MSYPYCDPQDPCNSGRCLRCNTDTPKRRLCVGCFEPMPGTHSRGCPTGQNGPPNYE